MRRKRLTQSKKLILAATVALLLCLIPSLLSLTQTKDVLRDAVNTVSSPLTKLFSAMGQSVDGIFAGRGDYEKIKQELDEKNKQLSSLREQLALTEQLQRENEQLREYLNLKDEHADLTLTDATIIYNNDPSGRTVTLNKGSYHGIEVGMPVLCAGGLYGSVSEVSLNTCKVTTLRDEKIFIGATVVRSGVNGTVCGMEAGENSVKLQYLDANTNHREDLKVGDLIVTSGFGETYPGGLVIGEITEVGVDAYDRSPYAYVRLYADYTYAGTLLIVTGEEVLGDES